VSWDDEVVADENREKLRQDAIEFAQLYLVFAQDGRGKALLEHWVKTIEQKDISPDASHQTYAYFEGRRAFVRGIQRPLELAQQK
jgi:hypothetical protein